MKRSRKRWEEMMKHHWAAFSLFFLLLLEYISFALPIYMVPFSLFFLLRCYTVLCVISYLSMYIPALAFLCNSSTFFPIRYYLLYLSSFLFAVFGTRSNIIQYLALQYLSYAKALYKRFYFSKWYSSSYLSLLLCDTFLLRKLLLHTHPFPLDWPYQPTN